MKKIEIYFDQNALNPFKDWGCDVPPIYVEYGRYSRVEYQKIEIIEAIEDKITFDFATKYREELTKILADHIDADHIERFEGEEAEDEAYDQIYLAIQNATMRELFELLNLVGIPAKLHVSRGYSQGDYAGVLIALTPEWYKTTGADPKRAERSLKAAADLFDAWAWGDVYGFKTFEERKFTKVYTDGTKEEAAEWMQLDSCGGFFGTDFINNGMLDTAGEEFRRHLENFNFENIKTI